VKHRQRGVALISILLIVALVTALVYHLLTRHTLVVAHTRTTVYGDRSLQYALGAEAYARQLLFQDWNDTETRKIDTLADVWALPGVPFDVEGGTLSIQIHDLDGRFNLNSVTAAEGSKSLGRFKTMLESVGVDPAIADRWRDWIDADSESTGFGAEDNYYLGLPNPYRAANRPAADASELRLLEGVDAAVYHLLEANVVALPVDSARTNINTATALALQSLSSRLTLAQAQALVESNRQYPDTQSLIAEIPELGAAADSMKVTSDFFEVLARAEINGVRVDTRSVLYRNPLDGTITLLGRDFGHPFPRTLATDQSTDGNTDKTADGADKAMGSGG